MAAPGVHLRSQNGGEAGGFLNEVRIERRERHQASGTMPPDTTAPTAPATLTGAPVAAGRIDLAWSVGSDDTAVAGYNVYRDGVKVNAAPVDSLSYSDTGLVAGASHTYSITALDAAGNESAKSPTWSGAAASGALTTTYSYDTENRLSALQTGSTVLGSYGLAPV